VEPRIFCIPATQAPVVAVLRRGPSDWCHVGRWDPIARTWQAGSWIHGTIYPQRCDLSPDGRWLAAFVLKPAASWEAGSTYISVSRLPWLASLAAWGTDGTWTRGLEFVPLGTARFPPPAPGSGDPGPLLRRYDLDHRKPAPYGVERARGWLETPDTPPPDATDPWDIRRAARVTLQKARPGEATTRLLVRGWYAAMREGEPRDGPPAYWIERDATADVEPLGGVQWADWAADGRLMVATTAGALEVRDEPAAVPSWTLDLGTLRPDPQPAPPEAFDW
jgi:hypothetical protein